MELIDILEVNNYLKLNAQLQKKKSALRKELASLGVMKKDKSNDFDRYKYFSEAGYKELFTKLFSNHGLELTTNEVEYTAFNTNSDKQPNGRKVQFEFILSDTDTGFYEKSLISGEGIDKGDKAGYKAYTGAIKYYLANTFMVATGDDPETESPEAQGKPKGSYDPQKKASPKQISNLLRYYKGNSLEKLLQTNNITRIEDLPMAKATQLLNDIWNRDKQQAQQPQAELDVTSQEATF